ncbi:hypothetical protein PTSG_11936 [Salpingoeca rosetta]|uniref:Integrase catalytic domain-containing protein n=1 Tax=Salpingoeca rosetta (strain ATCC 50818 / BSB-021) TaxID=946362 RepID=F2U3J1_SALR5|nr:uncharacterized protein PTSG_11936 [Salpingoeca rosetta]EGD82185.1 hypothetical protein PTSG_11936 [Salpingoeca rosetta]|eukprot:XP_004996368.1 hypothetical protein PTSG_11936 [Salpingoeca rosetta]
MEGLQVPKFDGKAESLKDFTAHFKLYLKQTCPGAEGVLEGKEVTQDQEERAHVSIMQALRGCNSTAAKGALAQPDARTAWQVLIKYYNRPEDDVKKSRHIINCINSVRVRPDDTADEYATRIYQAIDKLSTAYDMRESRTLEEIFSLFIFSLFHDSKPKQFGNEIKSPTSTVHQFVDLILSSNPALEDTVSDHSGTEQMLKIARPRRPERTRSDRQLKRKKSRCPHCGKYCFHREEDCYHNPNRSMQSGFKHQSGGSRNNQPRPPHQQHKPDFTFKILRTPQQLPFSEHLVGLDSQSSVHIFSDPTYFTHRVILQQPAVVRGLGGTVEVHETGTVSLKVRVGSEEKVINVRDVLFLPTMGFNILSAGRLVDAGVTVKLNGESPRVEYRDLCLQLHMHGTTYYLKAEPLHKAQACLAVQTLHTWHRRLGHRSLTDVAKLLDDNGISYQQHHRDQIQPCTQCMPYKIQRKPVRKAADDHSTEPGGRLHGDLQGPFPSAAKTHKYVLFVVDEKTRYADTMVISKKSDAPTALRQLVATTAIPIDRGALLQVDADPVFKSSIFAATARQLGVTVRFSPPYTHQHNGMAERAWRTVKEMAASMLAASAIPPQQQPDFTCAAIQHASNVYNYVVHTSLGSPPYTALTGRPPPLSSLRVFGCPCVIYDDVKSDKGALPARGAAGHYIGYDPRCNGHKIFVSGTQRTRSGINVDFVECHQQQPTGALQVHGHQQQPTGALQAHGHQQQPTGALQAHDHQQQPTGALQAHGHQQQPTGALQAHGHQQQPTWRTAGRVVCLEQHRTSDRPITKAGSPLQAHGHQQQPTGALQAHGHQQQPTGALQAHGHQQQPTGALQAHGHQQQPTGALQAHGHQQQPTGALQAHGHQQQPDGQQRQQLQGHDQTTADLVPTVLAEREICLQPQQHEPQQQHQQHAQQQPQQLRRSGRIRTPVEKLCLTATTANDPPRTWQMAMKGRDRQRWLDAFEEEWGKMLQFGAFDVVDSRQLSIPTQPIPSKLVLTSKQLVDGTTKRKVRLVCCGNRQDVGTFDDVFAPTTRIDAVRTFLAVTTFKRWHLHQYDVTSAFLHAQIDVQGVYVRPPSAANLPDGSLLRLKKSLYGLRQAPRLWYNSIWQTIKESGLRRLASDACVFVGEDCMLCVHVDDFLIAAGTIDRVRHVAASLSAHYHLKHLGPAKQYLNININYDRDAGTMTLTQQHYVHHLLQQHGLQTCRPKDTTLPTNFKLDATTAAETVDVKQFQHIVGSLLYLAGCTRPDVAYAATALARAVRQPTAIHQHAAKHVMKYLRGTSGLGITYSATSAPTLQLRGFSDASHLTDTTTSRGHAGHLFTLVGGPISWSSRRLSLATASTAETEYVSIARASHSAVYLRQFLNELGYTLPPTTIVTDNQPAIAIATNRVTKLRTKHIRLRFHIVRELVEDNVIELTYEPGRTLLADMLTKPLPRPALVLCRDQVLAVVPV